MERDLHSYNYNIHEHLVRMDREAEKAKAAHRDICELILQSPSPSQRRREWIAASEWTRNFNLKK